LEGFKSVFAVANQVAVYSNGFKFHFDKTQHLGMLCPTVISEHSPHEKDGWTVFILTLSLDKGDFQELKRRLMTIEGEMLLFMRRLRHLSVTHAGVLLSHSYTVIDGIASISTSSRAHSTADTNVRGQKYYRCQQWWKYMPAHAKRKNDCTETVLAFPFPCSDGSIPLNRNIFAFLPMHRTAFSVLSFQRFLTIQFLAHADFLTVANREGILEGEQWNQALGSLIPRCFLRAIPKLKEIPAIMTRLIEYIPLPAECFYDRFLLKIADQIVTRTKSQPIVLSRDGDWIAPNEAMILPSRFIIDGEPLFEEQELSRFLEFNPRPKYLKDITEYKSSRCQMILKELDCKTFNIASMSQIVHHRQFVFSEKSDRWLCKFFNLLYQLSLPPLEFVAPFLDLPFLKLQNGAWASRSNSIYLPSSPITLPDRINLTGLDTDFYATIRTDALALRFLDLLELQTLTDQMVIRAIIKQHLEIDNRQSPIYIPTFFEHAEFLSSRRNELDQLPKDLKQTLKSSFRLLDTEHYSRPSNQLILDRIVKWATGEYRLSSINSSTLRIVHRDYHIDWISSIDPYLDLRKFPGLLSPQGQLSDFYRKDIAPQTQHDNKLLYLLAEPDVCASINGLAFVQNELGGVKVYCKDGSLQMLRACYLPTMELKDMLSPDMEILQIADADNEKWRFLEGLGVTIRPTLKLYLGKLRRLRAASSSASQKLEQVGTIYEHIQEVCTQNDYQQLRYPALSSLYRTC
jgi:hypothetical protein